MSTKLSLVKVGVFGSSHGVKGLIKVFSDGDSLLSKTTPFHCKIQLKDGREETIHILSLKTNGNHLLAQIDGYIVPETVVRFRSGSLFMERGELPKTDPTEIYTSDLIDLQAKNKETGIVLDYRIVDVMDNPAHPILVFRSTTEDPKQIMVPFLHRFVGDWDFDSQTIEVIDWEQWFVI
ncbi:ribosome maturation factor RimM [Leptospira sp. 96542]|nr:ribosome maturation factor RimM [Leptospira sp. 96542]